MFDSFLQIEGIDGESQEDKHDKWIEVVAFNHQVKQKTSSTRSSSGGATTGVSEHGDIFITKFVDLATPKLFEACSTGKHFPKATIDFLRQSGDAKVLYLQIKLEEVLISTITSDGHRNGDELQTETLGLNYGKIEWVYTQQKRKDGAGGGNTNGKYDLTKAKA